MVEPELNREKEEVKRRGQRDKWIKKREHSLKWRHFVFESIRFNSNEWIYEKQSTVGL